MRACYASADPGSDRNRCRWNPGRIAPGVTRHTPGRVAPLRAPARQLKARKVKNGQPRPRLGVRGFLLSAHRHLRGLHHPRTFVDEPWKKDMEAALGAVGAWKGLVNGRHAIQNTRKGRLVRRRPEPWL